MQQLKLFLTLPLLCVLVGCSNLEGLLGIEDKLDLDIANYEPVIDTLNLDQAKYQKDLNDCRQLGIRHYLALKEQRQKEQKGSILSSAFKGVAGAVTGAVIGAAVGDAGGNERDSAAAGALFGGLEGAFQGTAADTARERAKYKPAEVVDNCLKNRGYKLLASGF